MVGFGYDSHRLGSDKILKLGGISIDSAPGPFAHSDGDAVLHALIDALLGAAGLGDIGEHFPDNDDRFKDADSGYLLERIIQLLKSGSRKVINIDITILLEQPKLTTYKSAIKKNIAGLCGLSPDRINIKAKSNEKMGFVGRNEGIAVYCVCELE